MILIDNEDVQIRIDTEPGTYKKILICINKRKDEYFQVEISGADILRAYQILETMCV